MMRKKTMLLLTIMLGCIALLGGCVNNTDPTELADQKKETEIIDVNKFDPTLNVTETNASNTTVAVPDIQSESQTEPETEPETEPSARIEETEADTTAQKGETEPERDVEDEETDIDMGVFGDNITEIG